MVSTVFLAHHTRNSALWLLRSVTPWRALLAPTLANCGGTNDGDVTAVVGGAENDSHSGGPSADDNASGTGKGQAETQLSGTMLIDDLEDGDAQILVQDGRNGYWYTYNDQSAGAQQVPSPEQQFVSSLGDWGDGTIVAATAGRGFVTWGAAMGFDFIASRPDGAQLFYDAGRYDGIQFSARGSHHVRLAMPVPSTVENEYGGTCEAYCNDLHGKLIELDERWREYRVPFRTLWQQGWGRPVSFDPHAVSGLRFTFPDRQGSPFDFQIDNVRFYAADADDSDADSDSDQADDSAEHADAVGTQVGIKVNPLRITPTTPIISWCRGGT